MARDQDAGQVVGMTTRGIANDLGGEGENEARCPAEGAQTPILSKTQ